MGLLSALPWLWQDLDNLAGNARQNLMLLFHGGGKAY